MKYHLSFCSINIFQDNIAEVIMDEGVVITLEMCEEYDAFLIEHFMTSFALLITKINNFTFTYEATLHIASVEHLKAMAIVNYNHDGRCQTQSLLNQRQLDNWNVKEFSGLHCGRERGVRWLDNELALLCSKE